MPRNLTNRTLFIALLLVPGLGARAQSIGNRQSPIDISGPVRLDPQAPAFEDIAQLKLPKGFLLRNTTGYRLADNRWARLKAYPEPASAVAEIKFGGVDYKLDEFHFHTPFEHLVDVLAGGGDSYRYPGSLTAHVNPEHLGGCPNPPGGETQQLVSGQLPEVVSWVVLRQTIQMSEAQLARFHALFPNGDARGPQALKGRAITKTKD